MTWTVGSLFSGAGGFDLGFDRAGFSFRWQVEVDPTARRVLARHWSATPRFRDVVGMSRVPRRLGRWQDRWGSPDVVIGGFPCQDVSVAGNRGGLAGSRSGLWWHMLRVVNGLRPRFLVWENVPGLLSSDGGRDFRRILSALADRGYFGCVRVLDAQHFGVPQRRRRVFGVFATAQFGPRDRGRLDLTPSRDDASRLAGLCAQVLALTPLPGWNTPPRGQAGAGVAGDAGGGVAFGGGLNAERAVETALSAKGGTGRQDFDTETFVVNAAWSCATQSHARPAAVARCIDGTGSFANAQGGTIAIQCHGSNVGPMGTLRKGDGGVTSGVPVVFSHHASTTSESEDVTPPIRVTRGSEMPAVAFTELGESHATYQPADTAMPICTSSGGGAQNRTLAVVNALKGTAGRQNGDPSGDYTRAVPIGGDVRRLTPTECERLMGWPDGWTEYGGDGKRIKDGPRYRLCGNGVVGTVSEFIAHRLKAVLDATQETT